MKRMLRSLKMLALVALGAWIGLGVEPCLARNTMPPAEGFANETPQQLKDVTIIEHLGEKIDLDLTFRDERGQVVPLRSFFKDNKPVLLSLAYYSCPSLCNFHLNGLNSTFKQLKAPVGKEFNFVVVSIEPKETSDLAAKKKAAYLENYGRPEGAAGWNFLVGDEPNIKKLADQVGFKYHWDEQEQQWAHASAAYVLTPDGRISRYLYGIDFTPQTLRLSLIEASSGKIGNLVDKLILFCFHFDPKANKYTLYAFNVMRAGGILVTAILGLYLVLFFVRNRREAQFVQGEA